MEAAQYRRERNRNSDRYPIRRSKDRVGDIPGVDDAAGLETEDLRLLNGGGPVLNASGHDHAFAWFQHKRLIPKLDVKRAFPDQEELICILVHVPGKLSLHSHEFHFLTIQRRDDFGPPAFGEQRELVVEVDLVCHQNDVIVSTSGIIAMRLWSLHPSLLDRKGLIALWREGLLAQKVLLGETKGYRFHPQLKRFQATRNPVAAISAYLWAVVDEATARGYQFDASKIATSGRGASIPVTRGQLEFERKHLRKKVGVRDPRELRKLSCRKLKAHPMMRVIAGGIEQWEIL